MIVYKVNNCCRCDRAYKNELGLKGHMLFVGLRRWPSSVQKWMSLYEEQLKNSSVDQDILMEYD